MHWSPKMMLDFASAGESHGFGRHAVSRYGEACDSLGRRDFNDRMDRVRHDVTIQLASWIENGGVMVASNDRGSSYRKQHL
jgi:hypothetical protein